MSQPQSYSISPRTSDSAVQTYSSSLKPRGSDFNPPPSDPSPNPRLNSLSPTDSNPSLPPLHLSEVQPSLSPKSTEVDLLRQTRWGLVPVFALLGRKLIHTIQTCPEVSPRGEQALAACTLDLGAHLPYTPTTNSRICWETPPLMTSTVYTPASSSRAEVSSRPPRIWSNLRRA